MTVGDHIKTTGYVKLRPQNSKLLDVEIAFTKPLIRWTRIPSSILILRSTTKCDYKIQCVS